MKKLTKALLIILIFNLFASFAYAGPDDLPDILPRSTDPSTTTIVNN